MTVIAFICYLWDQTGVLDYDFFCKIKRCTFFWRHVVVWARVCFCSTTATSSACHSPLMLFACFTQENCKFYIFHPGNSPPAPSPHPPLQHTVNSRASKSFQHKLWFLILLISIFFNVCRVAFYASNGRMFITKELLFTVFSSNKFSLRVWMQTPPPQNVPDVSCNQSDLGLKCRKACFRILKPFDLFFS